MLNQEIETAPLSEQMEFQNIALRQQLEYLKKFSKFYQLIFKNNNIDISKIRTVEDLSFIPTTTKEDLQKFNQDFICCKKDEIVDYLTTSGTTGKPVLFVLTESDLKRLEYNEFLSLSCAGCKKEDSIQLMTTLDRRFMAGLAYYLGARKIGSGIVRVGAGTPAFQWDTIDIVRPNILITVPSFIIKLIEFANENNIDYHKYNIQKAICIGDTIRNEDFSLNSLGKKIKENWDIELISTYASTEMSTAFTECNFGCGGHHHPELIVTEFLDEKGNPVSEGAPGELVVTTLGVEGLPLLRYKTGDICSYYLEPCKCGRKTVRVGPVIGRKNQMMKIKGTTLYPNAFYDILDNFDFINSYVIIVKKNNLDLDEVTIKLNLKNDNSESIDIIKEHLKSKLRVNPNLVIESLEEINILLNPEGSRKAMKFLDYRN